MADPLRAWLHAADALIFEGPVDVNLFEGLLNAPLATNADELFREVEVVARDVEVAHRDAFVNQCNRLMPPIVGAMLSHGQLVAQLHNMCRRVRTPPTRRMVTLVVAILAFHVQA